MLVVGRGTTGEHPLLLATLPPSNAQRQLALAIVACFFAVFVVAIPFAYVQLPRIDAWIPGFTTALVLTDLITSALLFSQFSIVGQRALLVLATSYFFSALTIIPYALTFPGLFAPTGLLGAGLQSAVWLYIIWHIASPLSIAAYGLLRGENDSTSPLRRSARSYVFLSIATVVATVCTVTWFVTAQHDLLPEFYADGIRLSPLVRLGAVFVFLACIIALAILWMRGRSVLDLWLMVTVSAWLLEITLQGLFLTDRFSVAWYVGRVYSLIAGSVVLIVLLSETTTLYAHLARSTIRQRAARQARQVAMDAMAASIAHEVSQPLSAIAVNTEAALLHLARAAPDIDEVRAALKDIALSSTRANQVIASLRAMFKNGVRGRTMVDINDLVSEVLAMLEVDLRAERVSVSMEMRKELPLLLADRGQLQQVFLNLIMNAIDAMRSAPDRAHILRITSDIVREGSEILISVADSGIGIEGTDLDRVFEPFFSTKSAGMGIGLTVCRSIIDSHGGNLQVSTNNPYGTIFKILVPIDAEASA